MRIVKMNPGEERRLRRLAKPRERPIDDVAAGALGRIDAGGELVFRQIEVVEVRVEALRNSPSAVEDERADEAAGPVAICLQHFRQCGLVVADVELPVVADAVE